MRKKGYILRYTLQIEDYIHDSEGEKYSYASGLMYDPDLKCDIIASWSYDKNEAHAFDTVDSLKEVLQTHYFTHSVGMEFRDRFVVFKTEYIQI